MQLDLPLRDVALFVRHRRARRYILRVLDDGTLRVTLPRWGSKREAQAFVEQSAAWVARQQEAVSALDADKGGAVCAAGRSRSLRSGQQGGAGDGAGVIYVTWCASRR